MGLLAPIVGRLYDRLGPKPLVLPGSAIVSLVLWGLSLVTDTTPVYLVLVAHVVLSLGLALLFTPLFTAGLGAVQPRFYSHGSAIVGTVQQVAGAAGTALFVTVMAAQSSTLAGGAADAAAAAAGVRSAFLVGGVISLFAIVAAFFIAKPEETTEAPAEADAPVAIH
jgi:DHA2 family lincomycin resistance protein-like MFS transporter